MSALVPTPFGSFAAASLTRQRIVMYEGRSVFSKKCSLGFEFKALFLQTGATTTLRLGLTYFPPSLKL